MRPDPKLLELLWSVPQVGRLEIPYIREEWGSWLKIPILLGPVAHHIYWKSVPRVKLDWRRTRALLPSGSHSGCTYSAMSHSVLLCLN